MEYVWYYIYIYILTVYGKMLKVKLVLSLVGAFQLSYNVQVSFFGLSFLSERLVSSTATVSVQPSPTCFFFL